MTEHSGFDVLIVGGGMVGCSLACLLLEQEADSQLKIALIEADASEAEVSRTHFDARVVALSNMSIAILKRIGVWEFVLAQRVCPYREMYVWDGDGTADVHFSCHDIRENQLGFIVENAVVLQALREKLASSSRLTIFKPAKVLDIELAGDAAEKYQRVLLEYQGQTQVLESQLVVAADGARSSVRDLLNIPTREWDYGHTAIVTTVETSCEHRYTAWQRFTQSGPIALLPLSDDFDVAKKQKFCSLVWSAEADLAAKLNKMSDAEFCDSLGRAFEYKLGEIVHADRRHALPLRQRHAQRYVLPGLALVGDAAHTIHPLAGQGVNLGLYDVQVLAEEIARSQRREFAIGDFSILQRYERRRQSHNLLAMATMEGFKRLFAAQAPALRWLRNTGMRYFNQQAWLKNKLAQLASG